MMSHFVVRVEIGQTTNRDPIELIDRVRRQADYLGGRVGFRAKRGQTDLLFRKRGYLRLLFPDRGSARRFMRRVDGLSEPAIEQELIRSSRRYRP
jgi:hypothetical protein